MRKKTLLAASICLSVLTAFPAAADLAVRFEESAPKDRFIVENQSGCNLAGFEMIIDLRGSAAGLLFDITPGGAGENVSQPFEIAEGEQSVKSVIDVVDGDRVAKVAFQGLAKQSRVVFTVDVDDSLVNGLRGRQMIDASEIAGATIVLTAPDSAQTTAAFLTDGNAVAPVPGCENVS